MKTSVKKLPHSEVELEATFSAEEFASYWDSAEQDAVSKVSLKGFRTGAAPLELARKAINPEAVLEKAVSSAVRSLLDDESEKNEWSILGQPKVEVLDAAPNVPGKSGGMKCKVMFSIFPEVKLPDYKKIATEVLEKEKGKELKITGEDIEKTIDWIRQSRSAITRVTRGAANGDLVEVDIESSIEGKPIEGGKLSGDRFVLGESRFIPGFDEKLVGVTEGKTETFKLKAPKDYWQEDLKGKEIDFKVSIKGVFERQLPELTDDFAKTLGPEFTGLASLRANIERGLMIERNEKERERKRARILEQIVKDTKADPPLVMIERTLEAMVHEALDLAGERGKNISHDDLKKELSSKAKDRVLANLAVHKIVEAEALEPSEAEVRAEAEALHVDPEKHYDYAYGSVRHRKFFEFLEGGAEAKPEEK